MLVRSGGMIFTFYKARGLQVRKREGGQRHRQLAAAAWLLHLLAAVEACHASDA